MQAKIESAKVQLEMVTSSVVMAGLLPIWEGGFGAAARFQGDAVVAGWRYRSGR